jgi:hypothetical protein
MSKPMSPEEAAELERNCLLDPEPLDPATPAPAARGMPRRAQRLQPLPGPYVRVPLQWILKPHKPWPSRQGCRLLLLLLYKSHWGQKPVRVTNALAAETGIPERTKEHCIHQLAKAGWLRIDQREEPSHTMVVTVLVHAG